MNTYRNQVVRRAKAAAGLVAAIFWVGALSAQSTGQTSTEPAPAPSAPAVDISHRAQEFVKEAAQANQREIAIGKLAEAKSQKTLVKDLAQRLRSDHQKNFEELQAIGRAHGIVLVAVPNEISKVEIERLQKATDADFDKEYAKLMLKDHVRCLNIFDKAVAEIKEQDVKEYAQNTLPALRIHVLRSEEVGRAVGLDETTISSILKDLPSEDRVISSR